MSNEQNNIVNTDSLYKSQWGQDRFLNVKFFNNKRNGVFVDVGAHDGVKISNSHFFEKALNWTGLCIEPIPEVFKELVKNRNCKCVYGCANSEDGVVEFMRNKGYTEELSCMEKSLSDNHKQRTENEIGQMGGTTEKILVPSYKLETLFDLYKIDKIDYLSIDVEGAEIDVLKGINFDKVDITIIDVEENYKEEGIIVSDFLREKGYGRTLKIGGDVIYLKMFKYLD